MNNYICYHLHTEQSLLDSCTNYKDYVDYAVQLGQNAIAFTEHGQAMYLIGSKRKCIVMQRALNTSMVQSVI